MDLVSIGEFARLARLSPKALRLYDELGLLAPDHVDPVTGYRWYAGAQLERARLVAALRRVGVPLARIGEILAGDAAGTAVGIRAFWAEAEAEHVARRDLVVRLVDRLEGTRSAMSVTYEVEVRAMPARRLLSKIQRVREEELLELTRELFIHRLAQGHVPRIEGIAGAPFTIYHGEIGGDGDGDGPVEWCWPVPDEHAAELAERFPDLTLRTEPAHEEAYVRTGRARHIGATQAEVALHSLAAWAAEQSRDAAEGVRFVLVPDPESRGEGPDGEFAVVLR